MLEESKIKVYKKTSEVSYEQVRKKDTFQCAFLLNIPTYSTVYFEGCYLVTSRRRNI